MRSFALLIVVSMFFAFSAVAFESVDNMPSRDISIPAGTGPIWDGPKDLLYDNGPFVTSIGTGVGGADESVADPLEENNGFGCQYEYFYMITDQFEVPAGETWDISSITLFIYQTEAPTTSTISAVYISIFDDFPEYGNLVYGDMFVDVLTSTSWTNCYRVQYSVQGISADRPIMANVLEFTDLTLTGGTYWLQWWAEGDVNYTGPWCNPITIPGQLNTGDSQQFTDMWNPILMGGTEETLGMPFLIEGVSTGSLDNSTWGCIKTSF